MADKDRLMVHAAAFSSVADAEEALATIEQLYKGGAVGTLDAAVIDKENGKPHVVKRLDRPGIRVIPEWFGAAGRAKAVSPWRPATGVSENDIGVILVPAGQSPFRPI